MELNRTNLQSRPSLELTNNFFGLGIYFILILKDFIFSLILKIVSGSSISSVFNICESENCYKNHLYYCLFNDSHEFLPLYHLDAPT